MKKKLAVIFGSRSVEHDVSIVTGVQLGENIDRETYDVLPVYIDRTGEWFTGEKLWNIEFLRNFDPNCKEITRVMLPPDPKVHGLVTLPAGGGLLHRAKSETIPIDVAIPALHGLHGEDGTVQGLLELAGLPYVGCGVLASAVCMDKAVANALFACHGIPHCSWTAYTRAELEAGGEALRAEIAAKLGWPIFVKPANAGSSVGVTKANGPEELAGAIELALANDRKVVFESFVDGQEVECAVIGSEPAVSTRPGEILAGAEFYTYDDKYKNGVSETVIPARLSEAKLDEVKTLAAKAYTALGCEGLARCDFFVERGTGQVLINEINTLPGFTSISMYPKLMEHEGTPLPQLIDRLIALAMERPVARHG